jgi:hypothetical protein
MVRFIGKKLNKSEQKLLEEVAKFTLDKFIPKSRQKKMRVNIKLCDKIAVGWQGECDYLGNENDIRKFNVTIATDKINKRTKNLMKRLKEPMKTIIHEMVHVKQYANNQMYDYIDGDTKFEGKVYKDHKSYYTYWDAPWEVEAYGRTDGIYEQFLYCKKHGVDHKKAKKLKR